MHAVSATPQACRPPIGQQHALPRLAHRRAAPRDKALVVVRHAARMGRRKVLHPCKATGDGDPAKAQSTAALQAADGVADIGSSSSSSSSSSPSARSRVLQTDPLQLAELLLRLSQLQVKPHEQWLQDVLETMVPQLGSLPPPQLASTLQVLGGWGFTPPEDFMQALTAAVQQQLPRLTMRHIADMTWGLAQLHNPRQPLLDELLAAARDVMLTNACAPTAAHAGSSSGAYTSSDECAVGEGQQEQEQQQQQQQQQQAASPSAACDAGPVCCPASLADLVWSVAKLQHSPGAAWLELFAASSCALLPHCSPQQLAQMTWAFARLRVEGQPYQPDQAWLDALLAAISARLREFDGKAVSLTAWGLATLKVRPSARWLFAFERQAERTLSTLAAAELACTLWALSELKAKRAHELRLGRLVRRQEVFWGFDFEALSNPPLLRVVRQLTLGPQRGSKGA